MPSSAFTISGSGERELREWVPGGQRGQKRLRLWKLQSDERRTLLL